MPTSYGWPLESAGLLIQILRPLANEIKTLVLLYLIVSSLPPGDYLIDHISLDTRCDSRRITISKGTVVYN